jgi:acetoin utilization deacetylase AcuC-like enzyme
LTGFIYHDDYLKHRTGPVHPEYEGRLIAIIDHLKKSDLWDRLLHVTPSPTDTKWILKVHTAEHLKFVKQACERGATVLDQEGDTYVCRESYAVALLAVGGVIAGIDAVTSGKVKNAFCAVRPPGHHAGISRAMGFCLFNNVAIGTRYAQEQHGLKRVAIFDWDVHHGNGTQEIFYEDPSVLYVSTHQYPYYPGTGSASERGKGKGEGFTLNLPLSAGTDGKEYVKLFKEKIVPALQEFKPDILLISAGFDAHKDDPLAAIFLDESTYSEVTRMLAEFAEKCCQGRIVSVLEGGYDLQALPRCVEAHLQQLMLAGN